MRSRAAQSAAWLFAVAAACLPLGMALVTASFTMLALAAIAAGAGPGLLRTLRRSPTAALSLALFAWIGLRTIGGDDGAREALAGWLSYHPLLVLPFLMSVPLAEPARRRALTAFVAGNLVAAGVSYGRFASILPPPGPDVDPAQLYVPPRGPIGGAWLMSLASFLAVERTGVAGGARSLPFALAAALLLGVLFFLVAGRTALVSLLLLAVVLFAAAGWRRLFAALLALAVVAGLAWQVAPHLRERVEAAFQLPEDAARTNSVGIRLEFYRVTASAVLRAPLLGHGTGSFDRVFAAEVEATGSPALPTRNPHNQYLLLAAETGVPGALLLVALLVAAWVEASRLVPRSRGFARGLVLTFGVACLANSFLFDGAESRAFVLLLALALGAPRAGEGSNDRTAVAGRTGTDGQRGLDGRTA